MDKRALDDDQVIDLGLKFKRDGLLFPYGALIRFIDCVSLDVERYARLEAIDRNEPRWYRPQ